MQTGILKLICGMLILAWFLSGCRLGVKPPASVSPGAAGLATAAPVDMPESRETGSPVIQNNPQIALPNVGSPDPGLLKGIAVLGDSFYDEYRGTDQRGGDYAQVTFNLVELLAKHRDFNFGPWGEWEEPRRQGFEYNWAHSGDTSTDLIRNGQHTGAAQQIREGKVTFVFIGIGANDFNPYYGDSYPNIYSGAMSDAELEQKIKLAVSNVTLAVDTILAAGPKGVAVTLFTQWELDPLLPLNYPEAERRQRVANSIETVNAGIRAMAADRGIILIDQNQLGQEWILPQLENGYLVIGDKQIDFLHNGDNPIYSRLADGQHIGTVASGLTANYYFIDTLNTEFGTNIPLLTAEEILSSAGL